MKRYTNLNSTIERCCSGGWITSRLLMFIAVLLVFGTGYSQGNTGSGQLPILQATQQVAQNEGKSPSEFFQPSEACRTIVDPAKAAQYFEQHNVEFRQFLDENRENIEQGRMPLTVIPVQIHIVRTSSGTGGISEATIQSEFDNYISPYYVSSNIAFEFCGATNYINSDTYYNLSGDAEGDALSAANNVPNVLNIYYVNDPDGACGWARFTFMLPSDYIVIANGCAGNQSTTAHEIGHYFDLFHTHETANGAELVTRGAGANCTTAGDGFCDTEAEPGSSISGLVTAAPGCSYTGGGTDSNGDTYIANPTNLMSYAPKACRTVFTTEQIAKIIFTEANGRNYISASAGNCCALDTDAPIVTCGPGLTFETDLAGTGVCTITGDLPAVTVVEQCDWTWEVTVTNPDGSSYSAPVVQSGSGNPIWTGNTTDNTACCLTYSVGVTTIDVTITDGAGNVGTCSSTVTLVNVDPPTEITVTGCPGDIPAGTSAASCSAAVTWTPPVGTLDGCTSDSPTVTSSHNPGDIFPVGTTQVTYAFTYPGLETQFCFFDVIVSDDDNPIFTSCPGNLTVSNAPGQCGANVGAAQGYSISAIDNCGNPTLSVIAGPSFGDFFPVGTTSVVWRAQDDNNNTANCSFTVTVNDTEAPSLVSCPPSAELLFNLDCDPAPEFPDYRGSSIFSDNCSVVSVTQTPTPGTAMNTLVPGPPYADGATIPVTITATDAAGNTTDCTFDVTLVDGTGPYIACPGDQTVYTSEEGDGACNISLPDFTGLASGGVLCGPESAVTITQSPAVGSIYTNGDVETVTLTATDASGLTSTCEFSVTFVDDTAPELALCGPDPAEVTTLIGACTAPVTLTPPTASDNCDAAPTVWGVRSDGGADLTAANGYTGSFSPCTSTVDWYAEDANGNVSDLLCTNTVSVKEPINQLNEPIAACQETIRGLDNNGEAEVCAIDLAGDGAGDACSDITITMALVESLSSATPDVVDQECITFTCDNVGLNYVILQFEDCSGNKNYCKTVVMIEDNQHPYIACPATITIECDMDNDGDPLAYDPALPLPAHLPNYPQANAPVDLAALADWFNLIGATPGQDAANGITGLPLAYDNCGAIITYTNAYYLVSDVDFLNPLDYEADLPINDPHECDHHNYNIIRTWTVTDVNKGLTRSCEQLIQVRDTTAPVIDPNGVADATLECSDDAGIAAALAPVPTATDNCYLASMVLVQDNSSAPEEVNELGQPCIHKRITRRWVATDACGNSSELVQILDLLDTTAPELTVTVGGQTFSGVGPHEITLSTDSGKCDRNTFFTITASDNCDEILFDNYAFAIGGSPLQIADFALLNGTLEFNRVFEKGLVPFEVSVIDDCGNINLILIAITIEDNEAPTLECNDAPEVYFTSDADVIGSDVNGDCVATILIVTPPFMDNCPQGAGFLEYNLNGGGWSPIPSGGIFSATLPLGMHTIEYRLTDDAGNVSTICSKDFEIIDDEDPVLLCPLSKIITVSDDGDGSDCVASYTDGWLGGSYGLITNLVPIVSDNCSDLTVNYTLTGATVGTGTFTVVAPGFPTPPSAVGLDIDFNVGNTSVVYSVMDDAGNMVQCGFSVSVEDDVDPTITCPADITADNDPGECNYTADVSPVVADNCTVDRVEYTMTGATGASGTILAGDLPGALGAFDFAVGTTYVYYTVYDARGNSAQCSYTVVISDTELPVVACPGDYTVGTSGTIYVNGITGATQELGQILNTNSDCETTVAGLEVTTTDNCCVSSMQYRILNDETGALVQNWMATPNTPLPADTDQTLDLSNQVFEKGSYRVELRSWDCHMNEGVCSFVVNVFDDEEPEILNCPSDKEVNAPIDNCGNNIQWIEPTLADVVDNCLPGCPVSLEGPIVSFDSDSDLEDQDDDIVVIQQSNGGAFAFFPVGERFIKYKATDEAGNTTFCIFSAKVNDIQDPTIQCPADFELAFNLDCDTVYLEDYTGMATISDNCGIASVTQDPAPGISISDIAGITPNIGESFTVTLTVTDLSGNTDDCTFDVTIQDIIGPTIACPAAQVLYTGVGNTDCMVALPDYKENTTAGVACGNEEPTVVQSPAPGTMVSGTTIVTMVAIDSQGLTSACSFPVTVIDNTAPTGVCAADPATATAAIGGCEALVSLTAPTVTDNCGGAVTVRGVRSDGGADIITTSGATVLLTFEVYQSTVTWYATDNMFNTAEICTNTVTVVEPLNQENEPTAVCQPLELGLKNNGLVSLCAEDFGIFSFDNCDGPLTYEIHIVGVTDPAACMEFDCDDIGTHEICLIVTDASGNQDLCFSTLTIQDRRDPFIKCPADITIACENDNGGNPDAGVTVPFAALSPFDQVFFDAWSPSNDSGQDAENGITGAPLAMDNCGGTVTYSDVSTQVADITACEHYTYSITRTWSVVDASGNDNQCAQIISVKDTINPYFAQAPFMLDRFINCDDPNLAAQLSSALSLSPTALDACYVTMELISDEEVDVEGCLNTLGQTNIFEQRVRTWRATDACGNTADYVQTIHFQDFTAPALDCPNGGNTINAVVDAGICTTDIELIASATDCQEVSFSYVVKNLLTGAMSAPFDGNDASQSFGPGSYCIEFTAEDPCGNESSCQVFVNVADDQAPTIDCSSSVDISIEADQGFCDVFVPLTSPTIADNCAADLRIYSEGSIAFADQAFPAGISFNQPLPVGEITFFWYAVDAAGNRSDTCSQTITVIDLEAPVEVGPNFCPGDVELLTSVDGIANYDCSAPYNWKAPDIEDNCGDLVSYECLITQGGDTLSGPTQVTSSSSTTFDFPLGTSTVSYLASDGSGNTWSCSFTVTVTDDEAPIALCQDILVFLGEDGTASIAGDSNDSNPLTIDAGSNDNCPVFWSVSQSQFSCSDLGANTVILTVSDASGNTTTCQATVTVTDALPPTIECVENLTVTTSEDGVEGDCNYEAGTEFDPAIADNSFLGDNAKTIDAAGPWIGFMNVFETPENGGGLVFQSGWGVSDVVALLDTDDNTLTLKPNRIGDTDPFWLNADGSGNKDMEGSVFIADNALIGQTFTFSGAVASNDLDSEYEAYAFIRVFNADFSVLLQELRADLVEGESFTVAYNNTQVDAGQIQYGFTIRGRNADSRPEADAAYDALGSVVIGAVEACTLTLTNDYNGEASLDGETFSATDSPYTINWSVADAAGNTSVCSTVITVLDDEDPAFEYCPEDVELTNLTGNCLALHSWVEPTVGDIFDNCGVASVAGPFTDNGKVVTIDQSNGSAFGNFPIGVTTVSYIATDLSGNTDTCSFTVTVIDTEAPYIQPLNTTNIWRPFDGEYCGADVNIAVPQAYDLCGDVTLTNDYNGGSDASDIYPVGQTLVTWTATDESGNSTSYSITVTVGNMTPPQNLAFNCSEPLEQAEFSWNTVNGAAGYMIQIRQIGNGIVYSKIFNNPNANSWTRPADFLPEGEYQWRVIAGCLFDGFEGPAVVADYTRRASAWQTIQIDCAALPEQFAGNADKSLLSRDYEMKIFPNPNNGQFTLTTDMEDYNLEVYDITGKIIKSQQSLNDVQMVIDLDTDVKGIYFIRLYNDETSKVEMFIIE